MFNWQGNSVLFEVAMCVMAYLIVLTVEMSPSILEGLKERIDRNEWGASLLRPMEGLIRVANDAVKIVIPSFIVAGVILSCMHQSSLGGIMVIASTKLHPFWYTPLMPLLFLLSAIMVGFPMVIFESLTSSKSLGREPEMELLTPLAAKIPWLMGIYMVFKFGDLLIRSGSMDIYQYPASTMALLVEIVLGILLPFFILLFKGSRRSPGWLMFASLLIILGVAVNRVNAYLVGFHPPFATKAYFPAIGEIALSTGLVCTLIFLYRVVVTYFPVLPNVGEVKDPAAESPKPGLSKRWTWIFRGLAAAWLVAFVIIYAFIHGRSIERSAKAYQELYAIHRVSREVPKVDVVHHDLRPSGYQTLYILNSPLLNRKVNDYELVRFSHRSHDNATRGNCAVCHHRMSFDKGDRVGIELKEMHNGFGVTLGAACITCHKSMDMSSPQRCDQCHQMPNEPDHPARLGLKASYHRQCIGCHQELPPSANAPTDCISCHHPNTPDHKDLIRLSGSPRPREVTARCLACHEGVGKDVLNTVHWHWGGHSPNVVGSEHKRNLGLQRVLNNYLIGVGPNVAYCAACHIGFGWSSGFYDFDDSLNIDCLVCHDTTGTYKKAIGGGGAPDASVDLVAVARSVGRPSRATCGGCHFVSDGGSNVKHGDLEPIQANPPPDFDIHMGRYEMRCQDCHTTTQHRIAGRSLSAPAAEGKVVCEKCHGASPHGITGLLSRHLNDHLKAIACETCHIPVVAKDTPTQVFLDYSKAGQDRDMVLDPNGKPAYDKNFGDMKWEKNLIPSYAWYGGTRKAYLLGTKIDPSGIVYLNSPVGDRQDPESKIYPFKIHTAFQPYDRGNPILVIPKLWDGFWKDLDWNKAIGEGMKALGLAYSGQYGFVQTKIYTSIHHEVVPKKQSLGCADCHKAEAVTCTRCHKNAAGMDLPEHWKATYPEVKNRLDFAGFGYKDDPAVAGSRFNTAFGRGTPPD
jgi:octaheme c-type cytochrome (tetrathionate reductase family)